MDCHGVLGKGLTTAGNCGTRQRWRVEWSNTRIEIAEISLVSVCKFAWFIPQNTASLMDAAAALVDCRSLARRHPYMLYGVW